MSRPDEYPLDASDDDRLESFQDGVPPHSSTTQFEGVFGSFPTKLTPRQERAALYNNRLVNRELAQAELEAVAKEVSDAEYIALREAKAAADQAVLELETAYPDLLPPTEDKG